MQFDMDIGAVRIIERLESAKLETYIFGETVRAFLMHKNPEKINIITAARLEQVKMLFHRTIGFNQKNGCVKVILDSKEYTVYSFAGMTLREYIDKSDFTINSIIYNHIRGICDFYGGTADIENKIVKCIGNEDEKFSENPILPLRTVRYAVTLGFKTDKKTENAIKKYAVCVKKAAADDIKEELNKILLCENRENIYMLHELGLMKYILPELDRCFGEPQKNKYHIYDVGMHIMKALEGLPNDLSICWAVLLHDVGKPNCSSTDSAGIIHFYGHHKESRKIALDILHRLRFDSETISEIASLIENHDVRIDTSPVSIKRMMSKVGADIFAKLLVVQEADSRAKNPQYIDEKLTRINTVREIFNGILAANEPYMASSLAVTSRDLQKLGYRTGREKTELIKALLEDVIANPDCNNRDYLLKKAKILHRKKGINK